MKNKITIAKLGGNIIDDDVALKNFLSSFSELEGRKMLVHGGGKIATKISAQLGIETKMLNGRRVTDERSLEIVTMVYSGLNKKIVSHLQHFHCNAIGLCGADGNIIPSLKRSAIPVDYGLVGDPVAEKINTAVLYRLFESDLVPVICPLTHENGTLLNTNADTIAAVLASALSQESEVQLIFCFEKSGVLLDSNDDASLVTELNEENLLQLVAEKKIHSGMLPKIIAARGAFNSGVQRVLIGNADQLAELAAGSIHCTTLT